MPTKYFVISDIIKNYVNNHRVGWCKPQKTKDIGKSFLALWCKPIDT